MGAMMRGMANHSTSTSPSTPFNDLFRAQNLVEVFSSPESSIWAFDRLDPITIQVSPNGAILNYRLKCGESDPKPAPFPLSSRVNTVEKVSSLLPHWIKRIRDQQ